MKQNRHNKKEEFPEMTMALLQGVAIAFVSLLLLLFASAVGISKGVFDQNNMKGIVLACTLVSSLLGGVYTLSSVKKQFMLLGMAVGLLLFLLLLLIGLCFYQKVSFLQGGVEILFAALCGGAISKFFSKSKKTSKLKKKS